MIKINKSSWHYRYITYTDINVKPNLCSYIRSFFIATFLYILIAAFTVALAFLMVVSPILGIIALWWNGAPFALYDGFVPITFIIALIYIVGASIYLWSTIKKRKLDAALKRYNVVYAEQLPVGATMPNLLGKWYRDFHDKTCSTLEFYRN